MRSLISHLRYAIRLLLKSPGFSITAVLILALGIGANTAIFSLVNCVLLKPLPYPNPDRLVSIYQIIQGRDKSPLDYPDYLDFRANQRTLDSLTAFYPDDFTLTGRGEPERISGIYASGSLFKVLGRPFLIGAPFALAGGILGLPLAALGVNLIRSVSPDGITRFQEVVLDSGSLMFVLAVTVCTALLAGVLPAWFSSVADPAPALTAGGERSRTAGPLRQKRQSALVAGQVALTFLLLTAAGLLARTRLRMTRTKKEESTSGSD